MEGVSTVAGRSSGLPREALKNAIVVNEGKVRGHLDEVVRSRMEQTLNQLLNEEADRVALPMTRFSMVSVSGLAGATLVDTWAAWIFSCSRFNAAWFQIGVATSSDCTPIPLAEISTAYVMVDVPLLAST